MNIKWYIEVQLLVNLKSEHSPNTPGLYPVDSPVGVQHACWLWTCPIQAVDIPPYHVAHEPVGSQPPNHHFDHQSSQCA